ncbi:MAG: ABC transporter substrate-binding protein [Actinomycetota bacterium]
MRKAKTLAVALVLLVAVACGDGTTPTTEPTAAPSSAKITVGFSAWPGWFPWQVAKEKGLFTKAGLDVDLQYFESYTDSLNALNAGKLDANTQTLNDTISSVAAGSDQVVVLVNDNSTGNDQIIAKPGITSTADLRGRTVGVEEGTVDHFLLLLGLREAGLGPNDISLQPLLTDAAASAFAAGKLDAVGVFAPFTTKALELEGSKALFTSKDFPGSIPDHLVVRRELLDRKADVQKLVGVWFETLDWIKSHPAQALTIMAKRAGVSEAEYKAYDEGTTIFTLEQNLSAFEPGDDMSHLDFAAKTIAAFLKDAGFVKKVPDLDGILDASFVKELAT